MRVLTDSEVGEAVERLVERRRAIDGRAYLLMGLGLVSRQLAERSVYLELILIFLGGVLGNRPLQEFG